MTLQLNTEKAVAKEDGRKDAMAVIFLLCVNVVWEKMCIMFIWCHVFVFGILKGQLTKGFTLTRRENVVVSHGGFVPASERRPGRKSWKRGTHA